jgi:uncharacterized protein with beta-barrel porin domain
MMNNSINQQDVTSDDSLKILKKRLTNYLTIGGIVLGSSLMTMNAANADAVEVSNAQDVVAGDLNEADDTVTYADSATASTLAISAGDITVDTVGNLGAANMIVTMIDTGSGGFFQIDGDVTVSGGNLTFTAIDKATTFRLAGNVTASNSKVPTFLLNSTDIIEYTGTTKNIDGVVKGVANDEGTMTLAGVTEFDGIIGASESLKAINVGASKSGDFNAAVDAGVITNLGTLIFEGALGANTITNSGTITANAVVTNVAAGDEAAMIMHTADAVLNLNAGGNISQDMIITATDNLDGTINIFDTADNAAGGVTTVAADGLIGASGKSIGTLNVGKTDGTKSGNLKTLDGSAVFAAAVNITGGNHASEDSKIELLEAINSTTITLSATGDADATFQTSGTTVAVAGTVDSASGTDGDGFTIIDADIATQFAGNVGAIVAIEKMDIAAIKVDIDGATNAIEAVNFSGNGDLEFGTGADQSFTGAITAATNEHGQVFNVSTTGTLTISGQIGTTTHRVLEVDLLDNTDTTFQSAIFALDLDVNTAAADDVTTFTIGNVIGDAGTTAGALNVAGGTFVLDTAVVGGTTVFNTEETNNADAGVELRALVIQPSANFTSGTVTFIDGATAASIDTLDVAGLSITDTALTSYTINATDQVADVTIDASAKSAATTATELSISNNEATAVHQLMEAAIAGDATLMSTLNDSLTGVNSGVLSTTTDLAKQAAPQTDTISGSTVATRAMTGTVQGIVSNRMASLRSGDAYVTGMSAGNGMSANSGFIQAFGSESEQKNVTNLGVKTFGFDSETSGLAIGFDGMTDDGSTLGLSASYSTTDVDGKGTGKSKNSIDSYTVSVYADKATENGYLEGSLTYGINDNNASRLVDVSGLDRTYSANYDSSQISLKVGGGVPNEVIDGTFVTPFASATATTISTDAYTEKSTTADDALRLKVAQDDINSLVATVGVKAHMVTDKGTPMISLALNNEFGDNQINSNNTYQGGGTKFKTTTDLEELSATLGLGYSFGNDVTSLNLNYEANANDDEYVSHYGSIKIVAKF